MSTRSVSTGSTSTGSMSTGSMSTGSGTPGSPVRSDRTPLSIERIVATAIEMADRGGVDDLSMRRLADELGFKVMSLYNHVANKDELLELMVDRILGAVEFVDPDHVDDLDWKSAITDLAVAEHRLILAHPWVASVMNTVFPRTGRWRLAEELLRLLTVGGFTDHLRDLGYHAITLHVGGFTQQQIGYQFTPEREAEMLARFHRDVTEDVYPLMVDHVRYHEVMDTIPGERPDEFRFVLDLILEGLERRRDGR